MITNPQRNRLASYLYGRTENADLAPEKFYIGLSTSDIGEDGKITGEVNKAGYARKEIANNSVNFVLNEGKYGTVHNALSLEWDESQEAWGTIKTVFITNSLDSNEALYCISVNRNVPAYSIIYFKEGDLSFSIQ